MKQYNIQKENRPQFITKNGKIFLKKFQYEKLDNKNYVDLSDRQLSNFFSQDKKDFEQLQKQTKNPQNQLPILKLKEEQQLYNTVQNQKSQYSIHQRLYTSQYGKSWQNQHQNKKSLAYNNSLYKPDFTKRDKKSDQDQLELENDISTAIRTQNNSSHLRLKATSYTQNDFLKEVSESRKQSQFASPQIKNNSQSFLSSTIYDKLLKEKPSQKQLNQSRQEYIQNHLKEQEQIQFSKTTYSNKNRNIINNLKSQNSVESNQYQSKTINSKRESKKSVFLNNEQQKHQQQNQSNNNSNKSQTKIQITRVNSNTSNQYTDIVDLNNSENQIKTSKIINKTKLKAVSDNQKQQFNETIYSITTKEIFQTSKQQKSLLTTDFQQDQQVQQILMGTPSTQFDIPDKKCKPNNSQGLYETYKQLDKQNQKSKLNNNYKNNVKLKLLNQQCQKNLMPKSLGIFSNNFQKNENNRNFNISHLKFTQNYTKLYSTGLKFYKEKQQKDEYQNIYEELQKVQIQDNNLKKQQTDQLLKNTPYSISELNLSKNQISLDGCQIINNNLLTYNKANLTELYLNNCQINDECLKYLLNNSDQIQKLRILKLNNNQISDKSAPYIYEILKFNTSLHELYLKNNQFKGPSVQQIFSGLINNNTLKVLDLSNNQLGEDLNCDYIQPLLDVLRDVKCHIIHLDLSNNQISQENSQIIAENFNVSKNQKLLGFHYTGNLGNFVLNPQGFLQKQESIKQIFQTQHEIKSVQLSGIIYKGDNLLNVDNCWICEGWQQNTFFYRLSDFTSEDEVYCHISFLNYKPLKMKQKHDKSEYYELNLMCPPKKYIYYFFTIPNRDLQEINTDQLTHVTIQQNIPKIFNYENGKSMEKKSLQFINILKTNQNKVVDYNIYIPLISCGLRNIFISHPTSFYTSKNQKLDQNQEKEETQVQISNSIWATQDQQTRDHYLVCLQYDLNNCNFKQQIQDEKDQKNTKIILQSIYQKFSDTYDYFSSLSPHQNIFAITEEQFVNFLEVSGILDPNFLTKDAAILIFKEVILTYPEIKYGLTRPMFLELLLKLVEEKYIKKGLEKKYSDGLKHVFQQRQMLNLLKSVQSPQKWRLDVLFIKENEEIIKEYWPFLKTIFQTYSTTIDQQGNQKMSLFDFQNLFDDLDEHDMEIEDEDLLLAFNYSSIKKPELSHIHEEKHLDELQFVEALARLSEDYYQNPQSYHPQFLNTPSEGTWEYNRIMKNLKLWQKLEGLIYYLYKHCNILEDLLQQHPNIGSIFYKIFDQKGIQRQNTVQFLLKSAPKHEKYHQEGRDRISQIHNLIEQQKQKLKPTQLNISQKYSWQEKKRGSFKKNGINQDEIMNQIIQNNLNEGLGYNQQQSLQLKQTRPKKISSKRSNNLNRVGSINLDIQPKLQKNNTQNIVHEEKVPKKSIHINQLNFEEQRQRNKNKKQSYKKAINPEQIKQMDSKEDQAIQIPDIPSESDEEEDQINQNQQQQKRSILHQNQESESFLESSSSLDYC